MEATDLTTILKDEHQGKWIIYSPSELVIFAYDEDPLKIAEKAKDLKGHDDLRMMKVLPYDQPYAPLA